MFVKQILCRLPKSVLTAELDCLRSRELSEIVHFLSGTEQSGNGSRNDILRYLYQMNEKVHP
jgi:hypothetical protein